MTDQTRTVTFTVEALKAPDGNKPGAIKTDSGNWINVWGGEFPRFTKGHKYRAVVYNKPYKGKDQWTVSAPDKGGRIEALGNGVGGNGHSGVSPGGDGIPEPALRFVSNVVGSAITAGTIKDPLQIASWADAAYMTFRYLAEGKRPTGGASVDNEPPSPEPDQDVPW